MNEQIASRIRHSHSSGAGDIAGCKAIEGAQATAKLIEQIPGTVFAAGDLAYERGNASEFQNCYGTDLGPLQRPHPARRLEITSTAFRTRPPIFDYWGAQAGPVGTGLLQLRPGRLAYRGVEHELRRSRAWEDAVASSPQEAWLRHDLSEHPNACIVAYGHHALFSSGVFKSHAIHPELKQLWQDLYAAHADLMLVGP